MGDETPHDGWPCLRCWTGYIGVPESSNCVRLLAGRTCWDAALRAAAHGVAFFSDRVSQARMRLVGQLYSVLFRRVYVCVASLANGAGERLDTRLPFVLGDIDELNRQLDWCVVCVCVCVSVSVFIGILCRSRHRNYASSQPHPTTAEVDPGGGMGAVPLVRSP